MATQGSGGSRWFMVVSLLAMATVLVLAGMHLRKPSTGTSAAASTEAHEPAAGESVTEEPGSSGDEGAPSAQPGDGGSADAAATNPEAVRNQ